MDSDRCTPTSDLCMFYKHSQAGGGEPIVSIGGLCRQAISGCKLPEEEEVGTVCFCTYSDFEGYFIISLRSTQVRYYHIYGAGVLDMAETCP